MFLPVQLCGFESYCHSHPLCACAGHQIMRISQYIIVFFGFFMGVLVLPMTLSASVPGWLQLHCATD